MPLDNSMRDFWLAKQAQYNAGSDDSSQVPLKGGGGGGTSGGMEVSMKDYVDARDAAVASDMHSEFARVHVEFANIRAEVAKLPGTWTLIGTALAIVSIIVAVLAFGGARFSAGISLADQREQQIVRDANQDIAVKQANAKLDEILKRLPAKN